MSLDSENENEGHSTLELDDENGPEEIERRRRRKSESPFIDLLADGSEEEKEDDEDDEDDKKYCFYRLKRLTEQLDSAVILLHTFDGPPAPPERISRRTENELGGGLGTKKVVVHRIA
jgi:hypothetical protein